MDNITEQGVWGVAAGPSTGARKVRPVGAGKPLGSLFVLEYGPSQCLQGHGTGYRCPKRVMTKLEKGQSLQLKDLID